LPHQNSVFFSRKTIETLKLPKVTKQKGACQVKHLQMIKTRSLLEREKLILFRQRHDGPAIGQILAGSRCCLPAIDNYKSLPLSSTPQK